MSSKLEAFENVAAEVTKTVTPEAVQLIADALAGSTRTSTEVAAVQGRLQGVLDQLDAAKKSLQKLYDACRLQHLPNKMEEEGVSTVTVVGVGRVSLTGDLYASLIKEKQAEAFEWMEDNGLGDLIKPTLNASSLKALAKERLKANEPLPEEFFKITPFTRASITRG